METIFDLLHAQPHHDEPGRASGLGRPLVTTLPTATVREATILMNQHSIGSLLVMQGRRLVGIFTERDALLRVVADGREAQHTQLSEVMTRSPQSLHPDKSFGEALHMMHAGGFRHVPVVEDGKPVGMISARDALGPELEDFVYEMLRQEQVDNVLA